MLYVESFGNPAKFARLASRFSRRKPLLAVRSGTSEAGRLAGTSHTAGAVTSVTGVDALFAASGVIAVDDVTELTSTARLLTSQPVPAGPRLAVVSNAGGLGHPRGRWRRPRGTHASSPPRSDADDPEHVHAASPEPAGPGSRCLTGDLRRSSSGGSRRRGSRRRAVRAGGDRGKRCRSMPRADRGGGRSLPQPPARLDRRHRDAGPPHRGRRHPRPGLGGQRHPQPRQRLALRQLARQPARLEASCRPRGLRARPPARDLLPRQPSARRMAGRAVVGGDAGRVRRPGRAQRRGGHGSGCGGSAAERIGPPVVLEDRGPRRRAQDRARPGTYGPRRRERTSAPPSPRCHWPRARCSRRCSSSRRSRRVWRSRSAWCATRCSARSSMLAAGGVTTDVLDDRVFLLPPVTDADASRAVRDLRLWPLLAGFRGDPGW